MTDNGPVSTAILFLLTFISLVLTAYLGVFCYSYLNKKAQKKQTKIRLPDGKLHWLDKERSPLIPGNFTAQPVQPSPSHSDDEDDNILDVSFKERDFSKLGRIIFVMRYSQRREELMVRLVQIEGLPVSHEIYNPNSAYVDVQLKYTGDEGASDSTRPPRLDICLQQVYYFIITMEQMVSHSLEFRINTFDDHFHRYVSGLVEVNLSEEMGDDLFTGAEVVFVREIASPIMDSRLSIPGDVESSIDDYISLQHNGNDFDDEIDIKIDDEDDYECEDDGLERPDSPTPSHMSWEPEIHGLSVSTQSLCMRCASDMDLHCAPLSAQSRSHSVGYLPTYEWTVKEIPLEEDKPAVESEVDDRTVGEHRPLHHSTSDGVPPRKFTPTPEQFYHIVPMTPLTKREIQGIFEEKPKRIAYPKRSKRKKVIRSASLYRRDTPFDTKSAKLCSHKTLDRSSSWPMLNVKSESSPDWTPEHRLGDRNIRQLHVDGMRKLGFEGAVFSAEL